MQKLHHTRKGWKQNAKIVKAIEKLVENDLFIRLHTNEAGSSSRKPNAAYPNDAKIQNVYHLSACLGFLQILEAKYKRLVLRNRSAYQVIIVDLILV